MDIFSRTQREKRKAFKMTKIQNENIPHVTIDRMVSNTRTYHEDRSHPLQDPVHYLPGVTHAPYSQERPRGGGGGKQSNVEGRKWSGCTYFKHALRLFLEQMGSPILSPCRVSSNSSLNVRPTEQESSASFPKTTVTNSLKPLP